ncbi:hypothetical protein L1887_48426 [Cichorium endivia]|nr:hypothetical protein L1887_48426 [Cichorium endivia]
MWRSGRMRWGNRAGCRGQARGSMLIQLVERRGGGAWCAAGREGRGAVLVDEVEERRVESQKSVALYHWSMSFRCDIRPGTCLKAELLASGSIRVGARLMLEIEAGSACIAWIACCEASTVQPATRGTQHAVLGEIGGGEASWLEPSHATEARSHGGAGSSALALESED